MREWERLDRHLSKGDSINDTLGVGAEGEPIMHSPH